jgi:hypothetical protein
MKTYIKIPMMIMTILTCGFSAHASSIVGTWELSDVACANGNVPSEAYISMINHDKVIYNSDLTDIEIAPVSVTCTVTISETYQVSGEYLIYGSSASAIFTGSDCTAYQNGPVANYVSSAGKFSVTNQSLIQTISTTASDATGCAGSNLIETATRVN